ncbi:sensor histidine kinase [Streptomyces doebereineriae]|uniref:histidine kinase n=1 Tax=Streptomyces doebereineriae TaxID=3075528 RepID=A0ABU2VRG8_9ACTN|nr:sensor histidine kinase [Streptomyces sp. DSM 41640]MDT0488211.1 sensor histidine kinase [Streptomyces sp. DSM 41640]
MTHTGGVGPRPRGTWWREGAITATAFALCLLGGVVNDDGSTLSPPSAVAYVIAVVSCAVLPVRHRAPLAAMAVTTASGVLAPFLGLLLSPLIAAPAVITAYSYALTARTERRAVSAVALISVALLVASTPLFGALSWKDASRVGAVAAFPLVAGVLGHSVRNRRAYLAAMEERALRAEQSRDSEARRRVAEERVRIARELHDLVAHQITLANAQATVAAHLFDTRPEQTRKSLKELVETTSDALDELRATVGLLRQSGDTAASPAEPAPGLSRLPTLLESFRRAGLEVSAHEEGTARPLPPGVDLTAYRIVQEALTNVTKHAGTRGARVRLVWNRDRVTITVADDGGGARTASTAATGPSASTAGDRPPGYGLIGMRERATAVGGQLSAGRRPEGGFLVCAQLPLPPAKDATHGTDGATAVENRMADAATADGRTGEAEAGGAL